MLLWKRLCRRAIEQFATNATTLSSSILAFSPEFRSRLIGRSGTSIMLSARPRASKWLPLMRRPPEASRGAGRVGPAFGSFRGLPGNPLHHNMSRGERVIQPVAGQGCATRRACAAAPAGCAGWETKFVPIPAGVVVQVLAGGAPPDGFRRLDTAKFEDLLAVQCVGAQYGARANPIIAPAD